jgi:hypothetical protein
MWRDGWHAPLADAAEGQRHGVINWRFETRALERGGDDNIAAKFFVAAERRVP